MSFFGKKGIVLGHVISHDGIEVDKAKFDLIANLPPPTCVKDIRSFLGHAEFYRQLIQVLRKIAKPLTKSFSQRCAFSLL